MIAAIDADQLGSIRHQLMEQARLFEDPNAYVAGVEDTLAAVRQLLTGDRSALPIMVPETQARARMI